MPLIRLRSPRNSRRTARIVLLEAGPRLLESFPEVRTNAAVTDVMAADVRVGEEHIASRNVIWTAGVVATALGEWLSAETDRIGRVRVGPDLSVPGQPDVFVVGDVAFVEHEGKPLPGVAQVAMQQGRYVGQLIRRRVQHKPAPGPFRYWYPPNMATVGVRLLWPTSAGRGPAAS